MEDNIGTAVWDHVDYCETNSGTTHIQPSRYSGSFRGGGSSDLADTDEGPSCKCARAEYWNYKVLRRPPSTRRYGSTFRKYRARVWGRPRSRSASPGFRSPKEPSLTVEENKENSANTVESFTVTPDVSFEVEVSSTPVQSGRTSAKRFGKSTAAAAAYLRQRRAQWAQEDKLIRVLRLLQRKPKQPREHGLYKFVLWREELKAERARLIESSDPDIRDVLLKD